MHKKSSKSAMNVLFCPSVHRGRCLDIPARHGAGVAGLMLRAPHQCPAVNSHKGRPDFVRSVGLRRFGKGRCVATDRQAAHLAASHKRPADARWSGLRPARSAVCQCLQCAPAIARRGLWRQASWPALPPASLRGAARWVRARICRYSAAQSRYTGLIFRRAVPGKMRALEGQRFTRREKRGGQQTAKAISSPDTKPSSTLCPRHQSPHAPMPSLASHTWLLPSASVVCA